MAFNPFHGFRKHRRGIFAILTIICMFTFVLAGNFRGADAFDWILSKFGASKRQGEVVTVMYGDKVYEGQVQNRQHLRRIANEFLKKSYDQAINAGAPDILTVLAKPPSGDAGPDMMTQNLLSQQARSFLIEQHVQGRAQLSESNLMVLLLGKENEQFKGLIGQFLENERQQLATRWSQPGARYNELNQRRNTLMRLRGPLAAKNRDDELKVVEGMLSVIAYDLWQLTTSDSKNAYVLGGTGNRQDTLDFMMWIKQADTLGIKLTDNDVRATLNRLTP